MPTPPEGMEERRGIDPETLRWRIGNAEGQIKELWDKKASTESMLHLREDVQDVSDDIKGLRRILLTTALGWVAGSVAFLLAVLQLTH